MRKVGSVSASSSCITAVFLFFSSGAWIGGRFNRYLRQVNISIFILTVFSGAASSDTRSWRWRYLLDQEKRRQIRNMFKANAVGFCTHFVFSPSPTAVGRPRMRSALPIVFHSDSLGRWQKACSWPWTRRAPRRKCDVAPLYPKQICEDVARFWTSPRSGCAGGRCCSF